MILNEKNKMMQKLFREFAQNEVKPIANIIDEQERFPVETIEKLAKSNMLGIPFSKEYGGSGGSVLDYALCVEEISKYCATTSVIISAHTSLCCWPISTYGTKEQKEKYLPDLLRGKKLGAFALTEANAGTDASAQETIAKKVNGGYLLNGTKIFITNAGYADIFIIFAMTDKSRGTRGISAFILEKNTEGFSTGKEEKKLGIRGSSTRELIFKDVFIPEQNLLGREGRGFKIAMTTLYGGRIGIGAQALGIASGALEKTIKFTKERVQFSRPISKFQNTQFTLADMHLKVEASRLLVYKAAYLKDNNESYSLEASMAKLHASQTAMYVTNKAVQLHGGYGFIRDYEVERMYRDAKITEIYEGTSEVQKMVIASSIL